MLAHLLVLGALSAAPEHGRPAPPGPATAERATANPLPPLRSDRVAVLMPAAQPGVPAQRLPATLAPAQEPPQARALAEAAPAATSGAVPPAVDAVPPAPAPAQDRSQWARQASGPAPAKAPEPASAPPLAQAATPSPATALTPGVTPAATAGGAGGADEDAMPPPVYATRAPPPFRLLYALRRGGMSGQAELALQRAGAGYTLELKGTVLGLEVLGMSSRGGLGPQGLMPERFVDRRRGKDRLAANFDQAGGRITYSGTPTAQPLLPGAQDRLSWMVQLAAIVEAAPARYPAGSRVAMSVSGARGDVDTWTFTVQGRQRVELPSGAVADTLRLTREPRRPYDTQVEVWLNPTQHHLPVRARLTVLPGGETLELALSGP